jgi:hypothetical protein
MAKFKKSYRKKIKKKNKFLSQNFILGSLIVVLMISSVFGIIFSGYNNNSGVDELNYNGYEFQVQNFGGYSKYITTINKEKVSFYYLPNDVEQINISDSALNLISTKSFFYFTSDIDSLVKEHIALAQYEFGEALSQSFGSMYQVTFINTTIFPSATQISCENATDTTPVIYFRLTNETEIENKGNCIYFNGDDTDSFLRLTSRVLYDLYGII